METYNLGFQYNVWPWDFLTYYSSLGFFLFPDHKPPLIQHIINPGIDHYFFLANL